MVQSTKDQYYLEVQNQTGGKKALLIITKESREKKKGDKDTLTILHFSTSKGNTHDSRKERLGRGVDNSGGKKEQRNGKDTFDKGSKGLRM